MVCCTTKAKYVIFWPRSTTIAFDTSSVDGWSHWFFFYRRKQWKEEFCMSSQFVMSLNASLLCFAAYSCFICCLNDELCIGCLTKHSDSR